MSAHFVVDTSVVMSWCFVDESNAYADAVLDQLSNTSAMVPSIWPLEVVNVLLVAERRKRIKPADSLRFLTMLSMLPIAVDHASPEKRMTDILVLGREKGLSSYDAAYLDLAMRNEWPLATLDQRLIDAAKAAKVILLKF